MNPTPTTAIPGPQPILGLSDRTTAWLRRTALAWALLTIFGLIAATEFGWLRYRPGGDAYEIVELQAFGLGFIVAILLSAKWEILGGTLAAITSAAVLVFAVRQLQPFDAAVVFFGFMVPGALWMLIDLHDQRPRTAIFALALITPAVAIGAVVGDRVYDGIFGPSHPSSQLEALPDSHVEWIWSGGVTSTDAVVTAKVDPGASAVGLVVSRDPSMADSISFPPDRSAADGVVRFELSGLEPDMRHHYAIEIDGMIDLVRAGTFSTFPIGPASFTVAVGSCARVGTNGAVFDTIRQVDPAAFVITGDLHYANIDENDPDRFRELFDFTLTRTSPSALLRQTPIAYVWDDHDYGANNADATTPSRPAAMAVFRDDVPHYPLAGPETAIHQAFTIGRVRVVMTDTRSARSPSSSTDDADKSMLGEEQKAWFKAELIAADEAGQLVIWVNSVPWIAAAAPGGDGWDGYSTERAEIADFLVDQEIDRLVMVSGDAHMVAIDDGTNSDFSTSGGGGFPVLHAAALDRPGHTKGGPYSEGAFPGGGQFGLVDVTDDGGDRITVTLSGRDWEANEIVVLDVVIDGMG